MVPILNPSALIYLFIDHHLVLDFVLRVVLHHLSGKGRVRFDCTETFVCRSEVVPSDLNVRDRRVDDGEGDIFIVNVSVTHLYLVGDY